MSTLEQVNALNLEHQQLQNQARTAATTLDDALKLYDINVLKVRALTQQIADRKLSFEAGLSGGKTIATTPGNNQATALLFAQTKHSDKTFDNTAAPAA